MSWFKPAAIDIEEALIGPVARGAEKDEEEDGAVDARSVEKIRQAEEGYDKAAFHQVSCVVWVASDAHLQRRCICRDEEQWKPAGRTISEEEFSLHERNKPAEAKHAECQVLQTIEDYRGCLHVRIVKAACMGETFKLPICETVLAQAVTLANRDRQF